MKQKVLAGLGLAVVIIVALIGYDQLTTWMAKRKLASAVKATADAAATATTEAEA